MESAALVGVGGVASRNDGGFTQTRLEALRQELVAKQTELDSLRALPRENKYLRGKLLALNDRVNIMAAEWAEPVSGEDINLRARLLAYQRHSRMLQEELERKEDTIVELRGELDQKEEDLLVSKRRCAILFERLQALGAVTVKSSEETAKDGACALVMTDEDDPTSFLSLVRKVRSVESERELLQEKLISLQEDYERRGFLVAAVQRENAALRASVSQLIQQVQLSTMMQLGGTAAGSVEGNEGWRDAVDEKQRKLLAYRTQREAKKPTIVQDDSNGG
ncbi:hypothetical protein DQ04_00501110 [Trypanosoma grayi]|uniref:hypothetical protein n=1 Tax=Trypanosoma grayi TaxID=71804 RepID=UPI0004F40D3B|nr:hypothetical protein DQ04_00501110 [Trypanosoma grayi]KEG14371.1 hypothetical protein DQ04_00501110 [Trypanosoma grayi]